MPRAPLPPELEDFLAQANPAVIATLRPDGHPHAVPTWYEWRDGRVVVNMDESRSRLDHMRRDSRVAVTVLGRTDWYSHVSILGRVVEIRADDDLADIDRLSRRYRGEPYWNRERRSVTALVEPERWFAWGKPSAAS
jgi:PPOX class probable F420-dependent enzyme